jgi:DNA-binding beta-propeller fold protein YncE
VRNTWGPFLVSVIRFIHLDENRGALYVTDEDNNRIQKFIIGGNGTGVTVAGNMVVGTGLNQLNDPAGIWVTRDGQTIYIADYGNNRVMKWVIGASHGSVVVGSASGVSGTTSQLLNGPGDVALDPTETYLYVSDYYNHRIQRFRLQ